MTTSEKIASLSDRLEARRAERAKAEATFDSAQAALAKAMQKLKDDFKVNSIEEAEALLASIQKKTEKLISEAEEALND